MPSLVVALLSSSLQRWPQAVERPPLDGAAAGQVGGFGCLARRRAVRWI
jgi:hypothetical protein